jgi:hypothetical protein
MKPILMILGLVLAVGAGAVGGIMAVPRAAQPDVASIVDARPAPAPAPSQSPELEKRLQALSLEISGLQTEIAALRDTSTRAPVPNEASKAPEKLALAGESPEVFAAVHRDAIMKVIADERAMQEKIREDERKARELKQHEAKAERAAQKFNLSAGQRQTLTDYYVAEQAHFEEMRAEFRNGQQNGDQNTAREAFRTGREWRANELTRLFGTDLGAQINEFENEGGRARMAVGGPAAGGGGDGARQPRRGGQNGGNAGTPPAPGGGNN